MKLFELSTTHPGNWPDISRFISSQENLEPYSFMMTWYEKKVTTEKVYNAKGELSIKESMVQQPSMKTVTIYSIENIELTGITGVDVNNLYNALKFWGFYVPGDKEWLTPCSSWKKRKK